MMSEQYTARSKPNKLNRCIGIRKRRRAVTRKSNKKFTKPLEPATRKKIDLMLTNLGWNTDEDDEHCNVFTERAKLVEQDKLFKGKDPGYVLYKSDTDIPIAIIEAKRKGQSVDEAIQTAEELYAKPLNVKVIFAYDGAFFKSWHVDEQKELYVDGVALTQLIPEKKLLRFLAEGYSISEVIPKIRYSRAELINIFKWANGLLRKEGLREGIERFTEFANLLFLKLISELEIEREREGEPRILDEEYCWESFCNLDGKRMLKYINEIVLPHLVKEYNHSGDVFQKELLIKNPKSLKAIVDRLSTLNLMDADSDVKGDAFEYFLKSSITIGNDLGEYFTPRHIVNLMVELVEPKFGERIYDPTCGTGGFLIATFNYIKRRCAKTKENIKRLKQQTIYGRELTNTCKIAKMNMILTGDGHNNIKQMDSLQHPIKEEYDVVLANIPYGQPTDYGHYYPVPSENGDPIFLQHIILSLNEDGGRGAVVIPEGLLFRPEDLNLRKYLLNKCNILAIISLPRGIFRPYVKENKTDIIIFERGKVTKSVWFYNLEADGFDLKSDFRKPVDENDIPDLLSKWSDRIESDKSWHVDIKSIKEHNYDLVAKTYQPKERYASAFPLVSFSKIMKENKETIIIDDSQEYKRITVKLHGQGVYLRDRIRGSKIQTKQQKVAKANQFIVAEIDAKLGGFGVVPAELDDAIVSSHYFLFDLDEKQVNPTYFDYVIRYGRYEELIQPYVKGTTNYAAIRPKHVLALKFPLPTKKQQERILKELYRQIIIKAKAEKTFNSILQKRVIAPSFKQR